MDTKTILHILRNPWGVNEKAMRTARLDAADAIEKKLEFTKEELKIIDDALGWYAQKRIDFAITISRKTYIKHNGKEPTKEDISKAFKSYREVADLLIKLRNTTDEPSNTTE